MEVRRLEENIHPLENEHVKLKLMGNISEIIYSQHSNANIKIRKISKDEYMRLDTGQVLEFEHIDNRADDKNSIRQSLSRLRDYLNTNITDTGKCRWVTITYGENMTDPKRLYNDFKNLVKRLRYKYGQFEYIVAAEPQGRGAWHMHVVMIFPQKAPFVPCDTLESIWGQGWCKVKKLEQVDNVGAYLTAYLGDMELPDGQAYNPKDGALKLVEVDEEGVKKTKRFIKGARLCLYPPKFNLYRCSRGIKKPEIIKTVAEKAEKKISAGTLTFERTLSLSNGQGFENIINYRYYNTVRKAMTIKESNYD